MKLTPGVVHGRVAVGHPVDVASGEFFVSEIDHELTGVLDLSFGRHYSVTLLRPPRLTAIRGVAPFEPFGRGWRPTWWAELRGTLGGGFVYGRGDGSELAIAPPDADGRAFAPDHGLALQRLLDGGIRIVGLGDDRTEVSLRFDAIGHDAYRLASFEKNDRGRIDVFYDGRGRPDRLVQVRERQGYLLEYDERGHIGSVSRISSDGSRRPLLGYGYDEADRLVRVSDERGTVCTYQYDEADRLVRDESLGGKIYTVRYDSRGRCTYVSGTDRYEERTLEFDESGGSTRVLDSHGATTLYEWNALGQVIRITTPCGEVTRREFDDWGRPLRETAPTGEVRENEYDDLGRLVRVQSSLGWEVRRAYDDEHRVVSSEEWRADVRARSAQLAYDSHHNVTSVQYDDLPPWRYEWSPWGELTVEVDPLGARRSWSHDELGNVESATNADGHGIGRTTCSGAPCASAIRSVTCESSSTSTTAATRCAYAIQMGASTNATSRRIGGGCGTFCQTADRV